MPLVKSPALTAKKFAANRANGRKSAGPRTRAGKDRIVLNALKHGGYSRAFRSNLLKTREDVALFDWIYARICEGFQPVGKREWREAERLARKAWCQLRRGPKNGEAERPQTGGAVWSMAWTPRPRGGLETNPRCAVKSILSRVIVQSRIRIVDHHTGFRLMFWVRRPRQAAVAWIPLTTCVQFASWLMALALAARRQAKTPRLCLPALHPHAEGTFPVDGSAFPIPKPGPYAAGPNRETSQSARPASNV